MMKSYCSLSLLNFNVPVGPWHKYATYFYHNILERVRTTRNDLPLSACIESVTMCDESIMVFVLSGSDFCSLLNVFNRCWRSNKRRANVRKGTIYICPCKRRRR